MTRYIMSASDYNVTNVFLRGYLAGMRHVTGGQYSRLLESGGLSQWSQSYPPANLEVAVKGSHLVRLNTLIEEAISPDLFSLFLRNLGREFGRTTAGFPGLKASVDELGPVKTYPALLEVIKLIVQLNHQSIEEHIELALTPAADGLLLIYHDCLWCSDHSPSQQPICLIIVSFYKELLYGLLRHRYNIEETSCRAVTGQGDCHILIQ